MSPLLFQTTQPYVGRITVTDLYRVDSRALTACCNYSSVAQVFQFSKSIILTAVISLFTSPVECGQDWNGFPQTRHFPDLLCSYPALFTRLILASVCSPTDTWHHNLVGEGLLSVVEEYHLLRQSRNLGNDEVCAGPGESDVDYFHADKDVISYPVFVR